MSHASSSGALGSGRRAAIQLFFALCLVAAPADATLRISASTIKGAGVTARKLSIALDSTAQAPAQLRLSAASIQLDGVAAAWTATQYACAIERSVPEGWTCKGPLHARSRDVPIAGALELSSNAAETGALLRADDAHLEWRQGHADSAFRLVLERFPLAWLEPVIARLLTEPKLSGGLIDARIARSGATAGAAPISGSWTVRNLDLDTTDGAVATAKLSASGTLSLASDAGGVNRVAVKFAGGEWLFAPLYVRLGTRAIDAQLAWVETAGATELREFSWHDPDALTLRGAARITAGGTLASLRLDPLDAVFPVAYERYAASILGPMGVGKLRTSGALRGKLLWERGREPELAVLADALEVADPDGRFEINGLALDLALNQARASPSRVAWRAARLYKIPLGAAQARLDLAPGRWRLLGPVSVPVLGGALSLERLTRTTTAQATPKWEGAVEARGLSLEQLSAALSWPNFPGRLDAKIPAFHYDGTVVRLDGGLAVEAFGGTTTVTDLELERPFGAAPSMSAQWRLTGLDLAQLTSAFSFGSIEGRLDGKVSNLRLVDWSPVQFDAQLRTDDRYRGDKRISQRAVKSLSSVGGGSGLEASLLRVFEHFSYDAIGLGCKLERNVCRMSGLDSAAGGYTIVRGAGLPRLTIVGHQGDVDWPVLVARLKAATTPAGSPVVE